MVIGLFEIEQFTALQSPFLGELVGHINIVEALDTMRLHIMYEWRAGNSTRNVSSPYFLIHFKLTAVAPMCERGAMYLHPH